MLTLGAPAAYATLDVERPKAEPVSAAAAPAAESGSPFIETRLFFGTERPDGGPDVTDRQFMAFVDRYVTPGFPDGLTVQEGRGQWRDAHGVIERERSYELILFYPVADSWKSHAAIEQIRKEYKAQYGQESVARVDESVRVDF
ncbi:DUF3574 domain-containing protein [Streptomyces sp. PR69]|uniref:DUF3574 domain-containing protein n=1 Tax=Streptomyces sp. PR69 TaxID=2984950 RepID=UPI002264DFD5|nr:DUF3574 domain-containing protein [Streptomyces sp. PR69]